MIPIFFHIKKVHILAGALVAMFLGICAFWMYGQQIQHVMISHPVYAADMADDAALIGASHNVFVGKVVRQVGTKERGMGPETQFEVEVINNIKGDLTGTVVVDQMGGYKGGTLYVVEGGDTVLPGNDAQYLLQPGSTYVLATRYNEEENWHTLNSYPTARKLLSRDSGAEATHLRSVAKKDARVQELTAAYPHEKVIDADTKHNNARNNYREFKSKQSAAASNAGE